VLDIFFVVVVVKSKQTNMTENRPQSGELIIYVTYIGAVRKTSSDCSRLQMILDNHGIEYTKVDLGVEPEKREQMVKKSGKKTLPQVFIDDLYIGGIDEIEDWNENEMLLDALKEAGYTGPAKGK